MPDKVKTTETTTICYFIHPFYKKDIIEIFKYDKTKKLMIKKK